MLDFDGDTKVLYGGDNDDDDSGSISHLSIRYGGKVVGLRDEVPTSLRATTSVQVS